MTFQNLKQNSPEWIEERRKGLGASDAPIVMGKSPYKTPYQLWLEKTGIEKSDGESYATHRGHMLEDIARRHYEIDFGIKCEAKNFEHKKHKFMRASLDGWNEENKLVLEIKCPGKATHAMAKEGRVPDHYWVQIQHQLAVTDADIAHYYSFDGESGAMVRVSRDTKYITNELLPALKEFWRMVQTKTPPEISDEDYVTSSDKELQDLVGKYSSLKAQQDALKEDMEAVKKTILSKVTHQRVKVGKAKIVQGWRKGSVDYGKIPELEGVDLEAYRKAPIAYSMIKL